MAQVVDGDDLESLNIELAETGKSQRSSFQRPELVGRDDIESLRIELAECQRSSFQRRTSSFRRSLGLSSRKDEDADIGYALQWAEIERLPTFKRLKSSLFDVTTSDTAKQIIDVTKLEPLERHAFIERLIKHIENDNLKLLKKIKNRIDRVGLALPTIEVRYKDLCIQAECKVVYGKPLPTLWNSLTSIFNKLPGSTSKKANISIINEVSGIIKPGRMTLLLGPPGCGKTSLLKALSGNLKRSLKVTGEISYNGHKLETFVPQKSSAYINQDDVHIPDMTVRETLDFSARCQGVGSRTDIMMEITKREKEAGIIPDPDIDTYMKAISVDGLKRSIQTDYILKILGLDICADTLVGDAMRRGISGGQKKRLTTGEMIVGPTKALFMDEISNGLDSSTAFQIVACIQQLAHLNDTTVLISLLQPAPETFELFDDIILMFEGKVVYHGPRDQILEFFEGCGFRCPERKGVADFLQEVLSKKDQGQYWLDNEKPYSYISVDTFSEKFKESPFGKKLAQELATPFSDSKGHKDALSFSAYSLSKKELFRACMSREFLLMRRNWFIYFSKTSQLIFAAFVTMTVFLRTRMAVDVLHSNYYMGSLFFALILLIVDGIPEVTFTIQRLQIFYKQKELCFYPAWAYAIPATILKIPLSLLASVVWTGLTYYVIGYTPEASRFFCQLLLLFALHMSSISMFRFVASVFQDLAISMGVATFVILTILTFGGFVITHSSMPMWLKWGFWVSPVTYGEIGLSVNEFRAPRWQKMTSSNISIGDQVLKARGLDFSGNFYWISVGALFGFSLLFIIGYVMALNYLDSGGSSRVVSHEKLSKIQDGDGGANLKEKSKNPPKAQVQFNAGRIHLPFKPLTIAFQNVQYYIDTPVEMREQGFEQKKIQLLHDITGTFRPGILTALMGVSGAGKTTLLDVLAGRKTSGYIEGEIKIGGYPKVQDTYARVSGYCEQTDTHSPHLTVEESVIFSAWMRLDDKIDSKTKAEFVNEVIETIELDVIKDELVGTAGFNGLSNEQRKRLTIAVELVSNPSVIFMDEPTTGLDARSAAIVMRAVKNIVDTGRTIVCTIHQPSIDIFESFDELILLKSGGHMIYSGPLGRHSSNVIEYFEGISGVPKIRQNYNPSTWMLEVTSTSAEFELGLDFAKIYRDSTLYTKNKELADELSSPPPGSSDLQFPTRFSRNGWGQFKSCLWKQNLSYWRSPSYNLMRILFTIASSFIFGVIFWDQGTKLDDQQSLFNVLGSMYISVIMLGINNSSTVLSYVATERNVMYRERFAGMYSAKAFALAQLAIEIPYLFIQALAYVLITYPMIGYFGSAYKIFWCFYAMFCTLMYFNYMGMLLVSFTPNPIMAAIVASIFYVLCNLFSGFMVPSPEIPKWWIWLYYLVPSSWSLNGLLTSQYGDIHKGIKVFDQSTTVAAFLKDYFGFHHDRLALTAVVLLAFPLVFASLFSYCVGRFNFQRR